MWWVIACPQRKVDLFVVSEGLSDELSNFDRPFAGHVKCLSCSDPVKSTLDESSQRISNVRLKSKGICTSPDQHDAGRCQSSQSPSKYRGQNYPRSPPKIWVGPPFVSLQTNKKGKHFRTAYCTRPWTADSPHSPKGLNFPELSDDCLWIPTLAQLTRRERPLPVPSEPL